MQQSATVMMRPPILVRPMAENVSVRIFDGGYSHFFHTGSHGTYKYSSKGPRPSTPVRPCSTRCETINKLLSSYDNSSDRKPTVDVYREFILPIYSGRKSLPVFCDCDWVHTKERTDVEACCVNHAFILGGMLFHPALECLAIILNEDRDCIPAFQACSPSASFSDWTIQMYDNVLNIRF